jgi:hypothetical protein
MYVLKQSFISVEDGPHHVALEVGAPPRHIGTPREPS